MNQRFRAAGAKKLTLKEISRRRREFFLTLKAFFRNVSTGKLAKFSIFNSGFHY